MNIAKIALIKLGSRVSISSSGTSGGTGETLSIIKMLTTAGVSVDVYSKILESDIAPTEFDIYDIESEYDNINSRNYDALLVMNGNVNYFGGVDSPSQTLNYWIINNFIGKVFYIMCDCNLLLKQIWPTIEKKKWSSNYDQKDIEIVRDDIVYISQARFLHKVKEKAEKYISLGGIEYFPFEKFPLVTMSDLDIVENPSYDLLYGGTFRGGKREADMVKYYFGYDSSKYNVEMFGKISLDNFNDNVVKDLEPPKFGKSVQYDLFGEKMANALATVIIGDPLYKSWGDLAQRIYESIKIGNVVLIDSNYDFSKRVFSSEELVEFCYVSSRNDVIDRLDRLKKDGSFRRHLITLQRNDVNIDIDEFCSSFVKLMEEA